MRESAKQKASQMSDPSGGTAAEHVPYDATTFFESFYKLSIQGTPDDRSTVDITTDMEIRFHYNATENAILHAMSRLNPPPPRVMTKAWAEAHRRRRLRQLDVGTGAGHWIDFFRQVLLVSESVGVEITPTMADFLTCKYADESGVRILQADVCDDSFTTDRIGGPVDYITAIGVMFHIVDDRLWEKALHNLAATLKPGGILFVGGEFGVTTRNIQFHGKDDFSNWRDYNKAATQGQVRVNKRVRSLSDWHAAADAAGLRIVDLVRTDREPAFTTPENDILVLGKVTV